MWLTPLCNLLLIGFTHLNVQLAYICKIITIELSWEPFSIDDYFYTFLSSFFFVRFMWHYCTFFFSYNVIGCVFPFSPHTNQKKISKRNNIFKIYSWLSSCCTARRLDTGFSLIAQTKVKARKSFLFTEKFPCIENNENFLDFVITFIIQSLRINGLGSSK